MKFNGSYADTGGKIANTGNAGGNQAHNNLQPYLVVNFIIKANHTTEVPETAQVKDTYSESSTDTYSCNYVNEALNGSGKYSHFYKFPTNTIVNSSNSPEHSFTISNVGRPIYMIITGDWNPDNTSWMQLILYKDDIEISRIVAQSSANSHNNPFSLAYLDTNITGNHIYKYKFVIGSGSGSLTESGATEAPNICVFEI